MATVSLYLKIPEELHEKIKAAAKADHRTITNWVVKQLAESFPEEPVAPDTAN